MGRSRKVSDQCSPAQRSAIMARIRATNTRPEIAVRQLLHRLGYRFRLHRRALPGTPDIVLPKHHAVIFVHGCFWHCHDCSRGRRQPATNRAYWLPKLAKNVERDAHSTVALQRMGWRVLTIWECQVGMPDMADQINRFLQPSTTTAATNRDRPRGQTDPVGSVGGHHG